MLIDIYSMGSYFFTKGGTNMKAVIIILMITMVLAACLLVRTINQCNDPVGTLHLTIDNDRDEVSDLYLKFDSPEDLQRLCHQPWGTFKIKIIYSRAK